MKGEPLAINIRNTVLYKYNKYWWFSIDIIYLDNLKLDIIITNIKK